MKKKPELRVSARSFADRFEDKEETERECTRKRAEGYGEFERLNELKTTAKDRRLLTHAVSFSEKAPCQIPEEFKDEAVNSRGSEDLTFTGSVNNMPRLAGAALGYRPVEKQTSVIGVI